MTFELLPDMAAYAAVFMIVATVAGLLAIGALGSVLLSNRKVRLARHQSIPTYYGGLVLGH